LEKLLADASPLFRVDVLRIQGVLAILRQQWIVGASALQEAIERAHAMPFPYAELKALLICDRLGEGLYRAHIARDVHRLAEGLGR
jgi:hypothetical protein